MDKSGFTRVEFYMKPEARGPVAGLPMHRFLRRFYEEIFGGEGLRVVQETVVEIVMEIPGISAEEARERAKGLWDIIDIMDGPRMTLTQFGPDGAPVTEEAPEDAAGEETEDSFEFAGEGPEFSEDGYGEEDEEDGSDTEEDTPELLLSEIENLVGVEDLKILARQICAVAGTEDAWRLRDYFDRCVIVFRISGGDGFSEYVRLLSRLLDATKIRAILVPGQVTEVRKAESLSEMTDWMEESYQHGRVITFDLAYKMQQARSEEFRSFLRNIYAHRPDTMVFFKLPYVGGEESGQMLEAIGSVFPMTVIDVPPFSVSQYRQFAISVLEELGYTTEDNARDEIEALIVQKRNRDHFYGFQSVKSLAYEIAYQKNLAEVREVREMSLTITEKDLQALLEKSSEEQGGLKELSEMIGIGEIKERIDEIVASLGLSKDLPPEERPSMHMLFTGAPGTGKTTVARLLGKILKEKGLLSKGQFFERSGRDLVGRYIGETAPITNAVCRDAYGSVLFIDEAYTLYHGEDDVRDFGREALDTLLTQMENHRQDFIVIFSGYSERIHQMMKSNPGLASRVPYEIKFRNYTREELGQIFLSMAGRKYRVSADLAEAAGKYFADLSDTVLKDENFANGRFVRNLYERTVAKAALRIQALSGERHTDPSGIELTAADFAKAVSSGEFADLQKKEKQIGFV